MRKQSHQLPSERQLKMMQRARWMVNFQKRYGCNDYTLILEHLNNSSSLAAGPALRLAHAVWDLEYRLRFPKTKKLAVQEENGFSHLINTHQSLTKARVYHVWKAIEIFAALRKKLIPEQPLAVLRPCAVEERDTTLEEALFRLDRWTTCPRAQPYGRETLADFATLPPHMAPHMLVVARAIWHFESWREHSRQGERFERFLKSYNQLQGHIQHRHQWLQETKVGDAANRLKEAYFKQVFGDRVQSEGG